MNAEIEMEIEKMYREADEIKRREENAKDLKRKWNKFLRGQKNAERGKQKTVLGNFNEIWNP